VFNRRIIEELRPETAVRVVSWAPKETSATNLDLSGADVIVADSLLAQHPEALRTVREEHPAATLVLLVHYLRCIDPRATNAATAADERATLGVVDAAITTSRFVRRALMDEGLSAGQVEVVRPGLDERYREKLPGRLGRGAPRMLTVANLLFEKGLQSFVEVLRGLRNLPWTWTLVGDASLDPEYAAGVFRRLRAADLTDRVTWTGPVSSDALRTWYDRANLFVLPSRFETCSLSTREAMARGLPVVGYRVGGLPENFGDIAAGHLAPPGNSAALRATLRSLLTDPMTRAQRGIAVWQRSRTFPTWEEAAERFRAALASLPARAGEGTA
jgi:glycosyltransferase involved in cell wall biosynthesis